jgi:hypothetical protein
MSPYSCVTCFCWLQIVLLRSDDAQIEPNSSNLSNPLQNLISGSQVSTYLDVYSDGQISDVLLQSCAELLIVTYTVDGLAGLSDDIDYISCLQLFTHLFIPGQCTKFIRDQYVSIPQRTALVVYFEFGQLMGFAFATTWDYEDG